MHRRHIFVPQLINIISRLGGVVVNVLATGPKGLGFKIGWEVKPEATCRKILRHAKDPLAFLRY
jgi:hypothetical protein